MMREQVPHLQTVADTLGQWADANDGAQPPRALGMAPFTIGGAEGKGVEGQRLAFPFSLWMLQRGLDHLASLDGEAREASAAWLRAIGGEAIVSFRIAQKGGVAGKRW